MTTYIPLDQSESAEQIIPETILPKLIYNELVKLIASARDAAKSVDNNYNKSERSHKAISIDGERGSGKTSILVNLKSYIESTKPELLNDVHILEPIDPTLLEDGESLFLHVIVAAVLHDEDIKKAQSGNVNNDVSFSHTLEKLASALESVDDQKDLRGMDKIRSLYGNKHLVNCVTDFFKSTLRLLNKQLLVLPIDDVDTSLNLAFENLEIIRRYLVAPCVLPIVSGDRKLYDEVCWGDFHGRLMKDSAYQKLQAFNIAQDLANEYQRKILPLPRRLSMPEVESYWSNSGIKLGTVSGIPLRNFIAWLEIFLAGPVNGLENSRLTLPIPSVRALTQFIAHCGSLITTLPNEIREDIEPIKVQRLWQMPSVSIDAIEAFQIEYQKIHQQSSRDYKPAYKAFDEKQKISPDPTPSNLETDSSKLTRIWVDSLVSYFQHETRACAINLTLKAKQSWLNNGEGTYSHSSLFATPLFQPLTHSIQFKTSELQNDLAEWDTHLTGRLPVSWVDEIKSQKTAVPYPVPEVGVNSALNWQYWMSINNVIEATEQQKNKAIFFISALCHRNYYTNNKRSMMLNIGRVFEVIIASLVSDPDSNQFDSIRQRAPFYSTSDIAPTKTLKFGEEQKKQGISLEYAARETINDIPSVVYEQIDLCWQELLEEVVTWRKEYEIDKLNLSPWLVYKVFNKVFSQVANDDYYSTGMKSVDYALDIAAKAFYGTWSAFGSFEKGELFGLPTIVANTNINTSRNFESHNEHFSQNILPFSDRLNASDEELEARKNYGLFTRTVTQALAGHPFRKWLNDVSKVKWQSNDNGTTDVHQKLKQTEKIIKPIEPHKEYICEVLKIDPYTKLTQNAISKAMKKNTWTSQTFLQHLKILKKDYNEKAWNAFEKAGNKLFFDKGSD